jgi:hypothetical protein
MFEGVKIRETLQDIIRGCDICQHNNPHNQSLPLARTQRQGSYPGEDWQIDFTHMQGVLTPVCFLVLVDTFTGWVEAFPCRKSFPNLVSLPASRATMANHSELK